MLILGATRESQHLAVSYSMILRAGELRILRGLLCARFHVVGDALLIQLLPLGFDPELTAGLVIHVAFELAHGLQGTFLELRDCFLHPQEGLLSHVQHLSTDALWATLP